ncbi:MAG TPA: tautomerase family protein [Terriglobales bacterium]|nr:tautomerase family protein [Terriglobales bacterium]
MPHVQITLLKGRSIEQKRRAVQRMTEVLQQELEVKPESLSIAFVEISREDYARNGVLIADRDGPAR